MNAIVTRLEHRQQQKLSPQLQQAVRLLQLSSLEFGQEVMALAGENPFLEADDDEALPTSPEQASHEPDAGHDDLSASADTPPDHEAERGTDTPPDADADYDGERDSWQADGLTSPRSGDTDGGGEGSILNSLVAESTLTAHLHSQLNVLPLPWRDLLLAKAVVESLDDDGYLRMNLDELVAITALEPPAQPDELLIALRRVQSLEPAGVAARDVAECLLLQVPGIDDPAQRELARSIIGSHLDKLAHRDVKSMARSLKQPVEAVEAACARIRRFDPRPGWRFGASHTPYIVPDVIVKKVRGVWTVSLNPAVVPKVRVNQTYAAMFQRHRSGKNEGMANHLRDARWTVNKVKQRFDTILEVAQAIVTRQHHFFDHGPLAIKPMALREIAEPLGLHESTVSRVTNNKYMATPAGVFELKYFFSRAMTASSGSEFSGTAIRGLISEMIAAESPQAPLSDVDIARQLAQQGLVLARRTITKYRQQMHVDSMDRRRKAA